MSSENRSQGLYMIIMMPMTVEVIGTMREVDDMNIITVQFFEVIPE